MTSRDVQMAIAIYRNYFRDCGVVRGVNFAQDDLVLSGSRFFVWCHCNGMLDEIERMVTADYPEKMPEIRSKLSFVQGCLWSQGVFCLDEITKHNRS